VCARPILTQTPTVVYVYGSHHIKQFQNILSDVKSHMYVQFQNIFHIDCFAFFESCEVDHINPLKSVTSPANRAWKIILKF
jgi:hypothetical protein